MQGRERASRFREMRGGRSQIERVRLERRVNRAMSQLQKKSDVLPDEYSEVWAAVRGLRFRLRGHRCASCAG